MKLEQYQKVRSLDSGSTTYHNDLLEVMGYDDSISVDKYKSIIDGIVDGLESRFSRFFRVGLRWYYVPKNLRRVRLQDWVRFEGLMGSLDGDDVVSILDDIIACLSYPLFGFKKYKDVDKLKKRVKGMDVGLALGVGFFLSKRGENYMKNMKAYYIERMMKRVKK